MKHNRNANRLEKQKDWEMKAELQDSDNPFYCSSQNI